MGVISSGVMKCSKINYGDSYTTMNMFTYQ